MNNNSRLDIFSPLFDMENHTKAFRCASSPCSLVSSPLRVHFHPRPFPPLIFRFPPFLPACLYHSPLRFVNLLQPVLLSCLSELFSISGLFAFFTSLLPLTEPLHRVTYQKSLLCAIIQYVRELLFWLVPPFQGLLKFFFWGVKILVNNLARPS